jgi:hypothetical protein
MIRHKSRAICAIGLIAILGLALAVPVLRHRHRFEAIDGWSHYHPMSGPEGPAERAIKQTFLATDQALEDRYDALFLYFLRGAVDDASPQGARLLYPGEPSIRGFKISGLEGFARTGSLLAAWVESGRDPNPLIDAAGRPVDLVDFLRRGLLAGTDPAGDDYWGDILDQDQRIVEAADIARIVWLTRAQIWLQLGPGEQAQIAHWLEQVGHHPTHENNWLLFPVTVNVILRQLGWPVTVDEHPRYQHYKSFYLGYGWFNDPPHGVDFYNAWGVAYELFWIDHVDPGFDHAYISDLLRQSADLTAHLISPDGIPIMGRSICYRTAVPVPILAASLAQSPTGDAGLARRALDVVWRYFVAHGALQDNALTLGYFREDLRILDVYAGPGSCHWGLRSLLLAFLSPPGRGLWAAAESSLPVERASYHLDLDKIGWVVDGDQATRVISISIPANHQAVHKVEAYDWRRRLAEIYRQVPLRPENFAAKYGNGRYRSDHPFFEQ